MHLNLEIVLSEHSFTSSRSAKQYALECRVVMG